MIPRRDPFLGPLRPTRSSERTERKQGARPRVVGTIPCPSGGAISLAVVEMPGAPPQLSIAWVDDDGVPRRQSRMVFALDDLGVLESAIAATRAAAH